ncbi:MAG: acetyltransferase family [Alphaproteobacteria bacterium]|nr:acetyltransferase family [Alphaproteobacteria bacterium]
MVDKEAAMLMQSGADATRLFGYGDRAECRLLANGAIALSGEPAADLNMIFLTGDASREEFAESLEAVRLKGVDAILVVQEGADAVRAWAGEAGLQEVGQMPLMEHDDEAGPASDLTVRLGSAKEMDEAMRVAAAAFELDEAACLGAMPPAFIEREGNDLWLAEEDGKQIGVGIFIRTGEHVGVYTMATPPAQQRRGIGGAILNCAMAHYRERGAKRFTLGATEKGFPLYERVGFKVMAMPHVYVIGASTQFGGG